VIKKNMIDFDHPAKFEATMFQTSSAQTPQQSYIQSSGSDSDSIVWGYRMENGFTVEGDITFPKKPSPSSIFYFDTPFTKSSLFGVRQVNSSSPDDHGWVADDKCDFQVYCNREEKNGSSAYFQLTSSALGIDLTSSIFGDVYNNERWNLAVKYKNLNLFGGTDGDYVLEFQGVNSDGDRIDNSFVLSASLNTAKATEFSRYPTRVSAGALRTNTTGSVVEKTDIFIAGIRYWGKHLTDGAIINHATDAGSFGIKDPNRPVGHISINDMPAIDTLQMDWGFQTVASSDSSGEFTIPDLSSGSADKVALYDNFGHFHGGKGYGFPASTTVVNEEYVNTLVRVNPENSNGADMVKVLTAAEEIQEELSSPTNLIFSIEKSLYQVISDEMIKYFSTSADLASIYFKAYDKYNSNNHQLELIRNEFFTKMENTPDVKRFYEYFKWIDDAVVMMLRQQLPAGAEIINGPINIIEGHLLERNKLVYKTPTYATAKSPIYEGSLRTPSTERME